MTNIWLQRRIQAQKEQRSENIKATIAFIGSMLMLYAFLLIS